MLLLRLVDKNGNVKTQEWPSTPPTFILPIRSADSASGWSGVHFKQDEANSTTYHECTKECIMTGLGRSKNGRSKVKGRGQMQR